MVTLRPDSEMSGSTKQALLFYLHKYLDFLQQAGHHVFFDLPEFHDGRQKATVDYSIPKHPVDLEVLCAGVSVHGINVQEINSFLHSQWMTAASLGRPQDLLTICLAEINSSWLLGSSVDTNFHVRFGPPKITALCQCEVIVYFDIEDIAFFSESDASNAEPNVYHNWQLAFVVDVIHEEGTNSCLKLDFATARFSLYHSSFEKCDALASSYFRKMVSFFSERYFAILTQYSMHIAYSIDVGFGSIAVRERPSSTSSESSVSWSDAGEVKEFRTHSNVALWTERTEKLHLGGFDQITSISEQSINTFFTSLRRKATDGTEASLARWSLDRFNATFSALKVRLMSNGKAVIWVNISEGDMAVAKESRQKDFWTWIGWEKPSTEKSTEMYEFSDLAIAFEVDMKMVEHAALDVSDVWHKMFKSSGLWTHNQTDAQEPVFKHLILQFQTATYVPDLSSFQSLGEGRAALNRLQTITHYMQDYLASLANSGYHIIHSVPISGSQSTSPTNSWCTEVSFQTISKTEITLRACRYKHKASEAPVILILGMSDNRPMPQTRLQWSSAWNFFSKGESPVGVASLSREAFLEARILPLFALINADTTIVPKFAGVIDGKWEFDLTTWAQHVHRKGKECKWKSLSDRSADFLQYEWQHRDGWNHKYEGTSGDQEDAEYSLSCDTRNELRISTGFNRTGLEIQLKGESVIKVSGRGEQGSWRPFFSDVVSEGECSIEIREIHARHLSQTIDLSKVAHRLKAIFEGAWSYSSSGHHSHLLANSAFARDGSFVTQIGMFGTKQVVYAPQTPSSHGPRKSGKGNLSPSGFNIYKQVRVVAERHRPSHAKAPTACQQCT
ncbi:hypothetical protein PHLCEN_2v8953 [Hermanssonia centrifuga]|uniref:Uncharacterized protein n=1 Tax=Hermanssonia centrifuga TaxID=98765 RepID=A0A2R6NSV4_9APHY|nr:hypothetical protein PHLCEN_2v8953 [Hermanssonia centrifuga]